MLPSCKTPQLILTLIYMQLIKAMDKNLSLIFCIFAIFATCIRQCSSDCTSIPASKAGFSGMFVFGDSTIDNGNNNFLVTVKKANYLPYGVDFPVAPHQTGRFTNGKNLADRIGDLLELPPLPSSLNSLSKGAKVSQGVDHGSAGSGILDSTGSNMGVIVLSQQITNFLDVTLLKLESELGCSSSKLLPQYLMLFSTGFNDYVMNFFQGGGNYATLGPFTSNMTSSLVNQITRLYKAGARKFVLINIGPIGCTPSARATIPNKACNETLNYVAFFFNSQLDVMLNRIKPMMPGFEYALVNFFQIGLQYITYPSSAGFTDVSNSCCEVQSTSALPLCKPGGNVCQNRNTFMYFDGLHPTEALYGIVAARAYNSTDKTEVSPFNIQQLAKV